MDHAGCARGIETFLIDRQRLREQLVASLTACGMDAASVGRIDSVVKGSAATLRAQLRRMMDGVDLSAKAQELLLLAQTREFLAIGTGLLRVQLALLTPAGAT